MAEDEDIMRDALRDGNVSQVFSLIKGGFDVGRSIGELGQTPLHVVVGPECCNVSESIKMLLEAGADPTIQDELGQTPLHVVVERGYCDAPGIIKMLLEAGADPTIQDVAGCTPLHAALQQTHCHIVAVVEKLLKRPANRFVNARDNTGYTALHFAAENNFSGLTTMLLNSGANAYLGDQVGDTALHIAAKYNAVDVAQVLMSKAKNCVNVQNGEMNTPLHIAANYNADDVAEVLVAEARLEALNKDCLTPLELAQIKCNHKVCARLSPH